MGNSPNKKTKNITDITDIKAIPDNSRQPSEIAVTDHSVSQSSDQPKRCNKKLWIILSIVAALVIAAVIIIVIIALKKKDKKEHKLNDSPKTTNSTSIDTTQPTTHPDPKPPKTIPATSEPTSPPTPKTTLTTSKPTNHPTQQPTQRTIPATSEPTKHPRQQPTQRTISTTSQPTTNPNTTSLQSEFNINTRRDELNRITVVQNSNEKTILNNNPIITNVTRISNLDIYILNEEDASPENQLYYSKMYTGAISIASECIINPGEKCELNEMVDLSKLKQDKSKIRALEDENINLKEVPLATCIFKMTDNDFITSMKCHEKFSEEKKNELILDLYFFRAPAIQRRNKQRDNITIEINDNTETNRRYIREQNGGLCNIYNNWGSLCTTDMNITTDLDGNFISYDEMAITNIYYDDANSFVKEKKSSLVDITGKMTREEKDEYRDNLKKLLNKLEPHMKEEILFPDEKFAELYNLVFEKEAINDEISTESSTKRRRLSSPSPLTDPTQYIRQKELFQIDSLGVKINLNFKLNPGLNTNAMSSHLDFSFDDVEHKICKQKEFSDIQIIIDQLRALSKAGNILATQLYDDIIEKLEQLPNDVSIHLRYLSELLQYYDLYAVFNHTLTTISYNKLSKVVINLSTELVNQMNELYYNIDKKSDVKNTVDDLVDAVYDYVNYSHLLVDNVYNNISELSHTLLDKNNPFTQITNYYLNNTFASYLRMVNRSRFVFETYFEREFRISYPKVIELIEMFEEKSQEILQSDREYIYDMYTRLLNGSYQIVDVPQADIEKTLSNLLNTYNYTFEIIKKIKEYIIERIDIKDSGYYISNNDIDKKNKTYSSILPLIDSVREILEKDDLIDKTFDEIMINFKNNYLEITKYMAEKKSEYFTLEENVLKHELFTDDSKIEIESKIKEYTQNILSKMKTEYDYNTKAKEYIDQFVNEYSEELNELIAEVEIILSEQKLKNVVNAFEISLNTSLAKLSYDIDTNINFTKEYFEHFYQTIYNDTYLIEVLSNYHIEEIPKIKVFSGINRGLKKFTDEISQRERTTTYYTKYNQISSQWNYTEKYLKNQLMTEVLEDYKKIFNAIKESLQSMISVESLKNLTEPENELEFYNSHANIIEKLQKRINKYFSEEIFKNKYAKYIEEIITKYTKVVEDQKQYIKNKHTSIIKMPVYTDNVYDFCIVYQRKICYGCTNCVWNTLDYGRFCIILTPYENNYLEMIKSAYDIAENNIYFNQTLDNILIKINQRVERYNSIMKILEGNLTRIKNETFYMDFDSSNDYLISYSNWVKTIIDNYYGNKMIISSYNYYYENIKNKTEILLDDLYNKWKTAYKTLYRELQLKYSKIKYTMYEFGIMGQVYQEILRTNLTSNYFKSIILFEQTEFNFTITQYYEYFYRLVNNSYNYIMANLPKEDNTYNLFFTERKKEINKYFNLMFNNITISENISINFEYQRSILKVEETDFFQINSRVDKIINDLDTYIDEKIDDIVDLELFENSLEITQVSLTTRFYLENREFGKLLDKIYEQLDEGKLFNLNFDKFKNMMLDNWIFDSNEFVNIINDAIYGTNKQIFNELKIKFEEYSEIIEQAINQFFNDDIENIIRELYSINIKELTNKQKEKISRTINKTLSDIKTKIKNDVNSIPSSDKNYYTLDKVQNTMKYYKNYIPQKINDSLSFVLNEFYENIKINVYTNCIENSFNEYLEIAKRETNSIDFGVIEMMNKTYNIGDIIYKLISEAISKYSVKTRKKIYFEYLDYYDNIIASTNFTKLQSSINKELDDLYKNEILPKINEHNKKANKNKKVSYDLKDNCKKEINSTIKDSITDIETVILDTKGSNFKVNFDCPFDFTDAGEKVIRPLLESLRDILFMENEEQIAKMNEVIKTTIISNLENFLENVVPLFGDEFFDRIIDYNINFKILDLYSNLYYAIAQNFLYLAGLGEYTDKIQILPIDLKYRLYRLNDLDHTIESKKDDIIDLLEEKLNELVADLTHLANRTYTLYIQENKIIQDSFSPRILELINTNLMEIMPRIEKEYKETLEKYLKVRFKEAFTKILDEETNNMLTIFRQEKERFKNQLDKLFSEKIDEDLHEVNTNIFNTIIAIRKYFNYTKRFSLPGKITHFFSIYANVSVVSLIETFRTDLENLTFTSIIENINNKSYAIRHINTSDFYQKCRDLMNSLESVYYNPIIRRIKEYIEYPYINSLLEKRDEILNGKKLRHLGMDEDKEIELKRQESQDVEDTFDELYNLTNIARNSLYYCPECSSITLKISNYKNKMSLNNKILKNWIKTNKYTKNIERFLLNSLSELYHILLAYYTKSNLGINDFSFHKNYYIDQIYTLIISSRAITASTLNSEYRKILDTTKDINETYQNPEGRIEGYEYKHKTEHMVNRAVVTFSGIKEYAEFYFHTYLKGKGLFQTPYVEARIVDKSRPEEMALNVRAEYGFCGRTSFRYNASFSDFNYTLTLDYNTKTNNINITTYTNFDKYFYDSQMYQIPERYKMENISYMGYTISFLKQCYSQDLRNLSKVFHNEVEAKHYNETMIIVG